LVSKEGEDEGMGARAISIMAASQRRDSGEGGLIIRLLLPASLARPPLAAESGGGCTPVTRSP